jgi:soluble lytic murein transglycosylase-like protein
MQLNTAYHGYCYDVEKNIRRACDFIRSLRQRGLGWYNVAVAYNCGYGAYKAGNYKHDYGRKVWAKWHELGRDDR